MMASASATRAALTRWARRGAIGAVGSPASARWAVASFVDAGNAFGGSGRDTGVKLSVGAGLRWRSPLGPARIDLAHPLDDDIVMRLHVRIGPDL